VEAMRSLPLSAHASERAFAASFSYGVISAHEYAIAEDSRRKSRFRIFNDIFCFHRCLLVPCSALGGG